MKRRDQILQKALQLFNERGLARVKSRDISDALNISVGNLTYHFATQNDIVLALWKQLTEEVEKTVRERSQPGKDDLLTAMYDTISAVFEVQIRYSFLFIHRHAILEAIPALMEHYQNDLRARFAFSKDHYVQMVEKGLLRVSILDEINGFLYRINVIGATWLQEISLYHPEFTDQEKVDLGIAVLFSAYRPYLTEAGLKILDPLLGEIRAYK